MSSCSIEGCNKEIHCRSLCMKHYSKLLRHGDANYQRVYKQDKKCTVEGCERTQKCNGYCSTHYAKIRRSGTLERLNHGPAWRKIKSEFMKTPLSKLDSTPDIGPGRRGYLAVNIINDLKNKARKRGIDWSLDPIDAYKMITGPCHYCGFKPEWPQSRIGIDRIDNTRAYKKDNCVGCCFRCNSAKGKSSVSEFLEWINRIQRNQHNIALSA